MLSSSCYRYYWIYRCLTPLFHTDIVTGTLSVLLPRGFTRVELGTLYTDIIECTVIPKMSMLFTSHGLYPLTGPNRFTRVILGKDPGKNPFFFFQVSILLYTPVFV